MSQPLPFDPNAPTDELISFALSHPSVDEEFDPHWEAIYVLRKRGTREVFDAATRLLTSPCSVERKLGVRIHAQLGWEQQKPFSVESVQLLVLLLEAEEDENVLSAVLFAFGHLQEQECVPAAIRFATHPDPGIRYAVAYGLGGQDDERAISTLITLTKDPDDRVRDWATFALGSLTERDGPELRAALWARLDDSDNVTRGEALKGLAQRRDERAVEAILAELIGPDPHGTTIEAAEIAVDPRLIPALEAICPEWTGYPRPERAIAACHAGEERGHE
jgi:HEAT repeat protein